MTTSLTSNRSSFYFGPGSEIHDFIYSENVCATVIMHALCVCVLSLNPGHGSLPVLWSSAVNQASSSSPSQRPTYCKRERPFIQRCFNMFLHCTLAWFPPFLASPKAQSALKIHSIKHNVQTTEIKHGQDLATEKDSRSGQRIFQRMMICTESNNHSELAFMSPSLSPASSFFICLSLSYSQVFLEEKGPFQNLETSLGFTS